MFEGGKDDSRCRLCGAKLSLIQRLSRAEFCSTEHQNAFKRDQERLALERLGLSTTAPVPVAGTAPVAEPEPEPEVAAGDGHYESFIIDEPVEEPAFEEHVPAMASFLFQGSYATSGAVPCMEECDPLGVGAVATRLPGLRPRGAWTTGWTPGGGSDRLLDVSRASVGSTASAWLEPAEVDFAGVMVYPGGPAVIPFSPAEAGIKGIQPEPGDPPMAGLAPLQGPQTLRFEPAICRTEAVPEEPSPKQPSKEIRQEERKRPARLRLAGNVRGVWRTRIGQAGQFQPRAEGFVAFSGEQQGGPSIPKFGLGIVSADVFGGGEESVDAFDAEVPEVAESVELETAPEEVPQLPAVEAKSEPKPEPKLEPKVEPKPDPKPEPAPRVNPLLARLQAAPKPAPAPPPPPPTAAERVDLAFVPKAERLPLRLTAPEVKVGPWSVMPLDLIWFKLAHVRAEIDAGLKPRCEISWAPLDVAAVKGRDPLAQPLPPRLLASLRLPKPARRKKTNPMDRFPGCAGEVEVRMPLRPVAGRAQEPELTALWSTLAVNLPAVERKATAAIRRPVDIEPGSKQERRLVSVFVACRDSSPAVRLRPAAALTPEGSQRQEQDRDGWRLRVLSSQWWNTRGQTGPRVPVAKGPSIWEIQAPPPATAAITEPIGCAFDTGGEAWD